MARNPVPKSSRFVLLAAVCVVVAALFFAQDVLMPLALAMLISFLLAPMVNRLERWRIGRIASVLVVVTSFFLAFAVLGYVVGMQIYDLANNIDKYKDNIIAKVEFLHPHSSVLAKLQHAASEVEKRVNEPEKPATTQSTQPTDKAADLLASEIAARANTPRAVTNETKNEAPPATMPTSLWTRDNPLPVAIAEPKASPIQTLSSYLGVALGPLGTAGIVIVFVIFMLLQREDLRNRLIRLTSAGQLTIATTALDDASQRISRYLTAQAIVNGTYGLSIALGLWVIGLTLGHHDPSGTTQFPTVILWGLLCAILRFIPYIGPWIAAAFPLLISLAVYKTFHVFIAVGLLFIIIELLSNNFMEPWLYGASTGMSTVAILVAAVFWTWLWGPVGLLLSTPLTVVLVVLGKYVPQLQFLDVMLGDEPVLDPPARVYQRLLALDAEEAADLLGEYRNEMSLEEVYDNVLLPAMAMAEQDRNKGLLDERRQNFIRRSMRDIVEEMGDQERLRLEHEAAEAEKEEKTPVTDGNGDAAKNQDRLQRTIPSNCKVNVVCLPAHDEADEIVNLMLAQLLELRGYCAFSVSQSALASEMIEQVEKRRADVVVVSALPPGAVAHARYLCKRVHTRFPEAKMAVGLWAYSGDLPRAKERITCVVSVSLVTKLTEMQEQIDQMAQPAIVREMPGERMTR